MQPLSIGWDIGGAHVKAALLDDSGTLHQVTQAACPLWQGLAKLETAIAEILRVFDMPTTRHIITMTGELVDLFSDRATGVQAILSTLAHCLPNQTLIVFAGQFGFVEITDVKPEHYAAIASANWLATTRFVAQKQSQGLLIDIGSTTTDILLFKDQTVYALGFTDYQRLVSGELIYTGIIRTAVMAIAPRALFRGQEQGLMAEYFATMADVYRLTGELNEVHDQTETADGKEKTALASALRLSRMTGYDFVETDLDLWREFAQHLRNRQITLIQEGCERQLSRQILSSDSCFVGAGVGRFLVKQLATQLGFHYFDFDSFFSIPLDKSAMHAADCAPAVAVASLYLTQA